MERYYYRVQGNLRLKVIRLRSRYYNIRFYYKDIIICIINNKLVDDKSMKALLKNPTKEFYSAAMHSGLRNPELPNKLKSRIRYCKKVISIMDDKLIALVKDLETEPINFIATSRLKHTKGLLTRCNRRLYIISNDFNSIFKITPKEIIKL